MVRPAGGASSEEKHVRRLRGDHCSWPRARLHRHRVLHTHERTLARPEEKACIDKCVEERCARYGIESPETTGLRLGEPKSRHLEELTLNTPNDFIDGSAEFRGH